MKASSVVLDPLPVCFISQAHESTFGDVDFVLFIEMISVFSSRLDIIVVTLAPLGSPRVTLSHDIQCK